MQAAHGFAQQSPHYANLGAFINLEVGAQAWAQQPAASKLRQRSCVLPGMTVICTLCRVPGWVAAAPQPLGPLYATPVSPLNSFHVPCDLPAPASMTGFARSAPPPVPPRPWAAAGYPSCSNTQAPGRWRLGRRGRPTHTGHASPRWAVARGIGGQTEREYQAFIEQIRYQLRQRHSTVLWHVGSILGGRP